MLREAAALQMADGPVSGRTAFGAWAVVSWRALVAAAVLSLVLGAALFEGVAGERSSVAPAVRPGGFSHEGLLSLPLAAQGPVSAAMGADSAAYRVSASNGGFTAANPSQRLSSSFDRAGASVSSGSTHVGLSLQAVGYGTSLTALGQVAPRLEANRVVYARGGLSEWYVNGPLGLEQGFTIPRTPAGHPAGPLTLSMALSGNAHASLVAGGQSIKLSRTGGPTLRYSGLSATDAHGRALHSWLELQNGWLLLRIDVSGARYPLRIDPFIQQGEKLTGSGEIGRGEFGVSVALSSDGNTALIGGGTDNGHIGGAWVFTRSGSTWTQQGEKLTGGGENANGWFGFSVALSSDGNTALIGSPESNTEGADVGAAFVFTRSGSTWTQRAKLTGSGEIGTGLFGESVALSADGTTALIGASYDNESVGSAFVFTRSGETWTQQGDKLTGGGEIGHGEFGSSVALSSDGNTALIGGSGDNEDLGGAWVFTRSGSTWTQQGEKLTGPSEGSGEGGFGCCTSALSADGNTALIADFAPGGNTAWVFTRSGSTWTQQAKLTGSGATAGSEGSTVALSANGNTALIGADADSAAWVFTRSGETWTQEGGQLAVEGVGSFGHSVALSSEGTTALIGAPEADGEEGAAWVFVLSYQPEYGRCVKVPAEKEGNKTVYHGGFTAATCLVASGTHIGKYEWYPGVLKTPFKTKLASVAVTLESAVKTSKVTCTGETSAGEYTGQKTVGGVVLALTGCKRGTEKCSSMGAAPEEIVTNALEGELGVETLGATSASNKIGLDLYPVGKTGPVMEFSCGITTVSVQGSVIAPVSADKMSLTQALKAKALKGKQKPEGFAGGPKDILEESFNSAPFEQTGLTVAITQTNEEAVEVNSVF